MIALYGWFNTSRYKVKKSLLEGDSVKATKLGFSGRKADTDG